MSDQDYLQLYKKLIADRLPLADNPEDWKQRDMEALSSLIEQKSNIKLSLSTLKRLWKPNFDQTPHPSTLDALVSVLDCSSWLDFKSKYQQRVFEAPPKKSPLKKNLAWAGGLLLMFVLVGFLVIKPTFGPMNISPNTLSANLVETHGPVPFSANKTVAVGVPNTVVFKYDLSNVRADSFFIQQSWNELHQVAIDPAASNFSSTYYTPGFHRAKLIANDSIISRRRVHIKTEGWMALARYHRDDLVPIYLRDPNIVSKNGLQVTARQLAGAGVDLSKNFILGYYNIKDFQGLTSDNFNLETRLKCDSLGNYACPEAMITLICEEHIFYLPLTSKGCVGNLSVKFGEVVKSSSNSDLTALGREVYQWQDVQIQVRNKHAQVWLNDQLSYESSFKEDFGNIMGVVVSFYGPGSVQYLSLGDNQNRIALDHPN